MKSRRVTLYVKSAKSVVGTETRNVKPLISGGPGLRPGGFRTVPPDTMYSVEEVPKYGFVLPEDQRGFIETVKDVARRLGLTLEIVDVAKENVFRKEFQKEIEKIRTFPTLITGSGKRVEGLISKERLESVLLGN